MPQDKLICRPPVVEDGAAMERLVRQSGVLDPNSTYCYLLLCSHFAGTCAVAEDDGALVGFVTAYRPPGREDTLFVWQVGVAETMRGRGLATRLIRHLLAREGCTRVRFLEATVGPSNHASRALFAGLAQKLDTQLVEDAGYDAALFPTGNHEPERLLRIGPFSAPQPTTN